MTKVSNSQIMDWQKCQKRFYFSQILKLRPKELPVAMSKGLGGHSLFETFFKAMQLGHSYEECISACDSVLVELARTNPAGLDVYRHVLAFGGFAFQQAWSIEHVEEIMMWEIGEGKTFVFTPDLVYRATTGPLKGKLIMLDFKFTGQYWTENELAVYQQLPKYSAYYKKVHNEPIRAAYVVMLNTRATAGATGEKLYLMKPINLDKTKLANITIENELLVDEVVAAKNGERKFLRTVDTYACKMCFFAGDLCPMDLAGHPIERTASIAYDYNDYFDQYEIGRSDRG